MSDVMTPEQRSRAMSHIKGKDTSIEVLLRKALWHKDIRYRKNHKKLPGTPDIAITKYKIAIFCDSEFFMAIIGKSRNRSWGTTGNIGSKRLSAIWPVIGRMTSS